jgi:hypothetical protein
VVTISLLKDFVLIFQSYRGHVLLSTLTNTPKFSFLDLQNSRAILKEDPLQMVNLEVESIHHVIDQFLLFIQLRSYPILETGRGDSKLYIDHFSSDFHRNPSYEYETYFNHRIEVANQLTPSKEFENLAQLDFQILPKSPNENLSSAFPFQLGQQLFLLIIFTSPNVSLIFI